MTSRRTVLVIALDDEQGGCWIWQGAKDSAGYPRLHITRARGKGYAEHAHRWAYARWRGPIPRGCHVHHLCEVPACVNPDHLKALDPGVHTIIGRNPAGQNVLKTHCKRGHVFDEANTYWFNGGKWRACKACREIAARQRWAPKSA